MHNFDSLFNLGLPNTIAYDGLTRVTDSSELLVDARLSDDDKRALLASWASDANAVPHLPTHRESCRHSEVIKGFGLARRQRP